MFKNIKVTLLIFIIILLSLLINLGYLSADEIVLMNGDRISGTITKVEEGILILTTDYSEPVKIKKEMIKQISTDKPVEIYLTGGEILKGRLKTYVDGRLVVEPGMERETAVINWNKVVSINPSPVSPSTWKGNVTLGANLQSGNTQHASVSIGAETVRKTRQDRFSLRFLHNYAKEEDEVTIRNTYGSLKYDYFFTKSLFGYLGVELLNDTFKDLNLRTVVGPGIGYQIWDDKIKSLLFELGVSYFFEDLEKGEDDHWVTGRVGSHISYRILDGVIFSDQLIVYPSIEDFGEYQLRNEASLISSLGSKWALKFTNILEYDSDPPEDVEKNDLYWILSLQYSF